MANHNVVILKVAEGNLRGKREPGIWGGNFISFQGVPYAEPPVGQLRFKDPVEPKPWSGIRDATQFCNTCASPILEQFPEGGFTTKIIGCEDCLVLNIYTRHLKTEVKELMPVMVFIHGGAFTTGSSSREVYGPEYFMTQNVVLVTINYRLGALGFLSFENYYGGISNAGLKDQVMALEWIQKNIRYFGGHPDKVTLFGESAGAASVHYLMASSSSALTTFHKAILQSGSALCPFASGQNSARKLATVMGCTETEDSKILAFLQAAPVERLLEGQAALGDWLSVGMRRNFGPCIDGTFLREEPVAQLLSGTHHTVPIMMGYTSKEGILVEVDKLGMSVGSNEFVPFVLGHEKESTTYDQVNKKIIQYYFGSEKVNPSNKDALYLAFGDAALLRGVHSAVKAFARFSKHPVYYYRMSLDGELNYFKESVLQMHIDGAAHGDDLGYLFKYSDYVVQADSVEGIAIKRFIRMWTNFASEGDPTPTSEIDPLLGVKWEPISGEELNFLNIDTELVPGTDPDKARMQFWDDIYKDGPAGY